MSCIVITGVGGVFGSAVAERFHRLGYEVVGVDNDLRGRLLGDTKGSTQWNIDRMAGSLGHFVNHSVDVRDTAGLASLFEQYARDVKVIVHCAAQPAHEGHVREDFEINAVGTLNMLDVWKRHCPDAAFVYASTIKVYGSYPNTLSYSGSRSRIDLPPDHPHHNGLDENTPLDQGMASFFGRSKTTADLYVQEYAYQYGLKAVCFRASCITGGLHCGTEAHGMLSYMMRCAHTGSPYYIFGYEGRQVRDQIHADDLAAAIEVVVDQPTKQVVYNVGGGRENACSILEAIEVCEQLTGKKMNVALRPERKGDHPWWITDTTRLRTDYPLWQVTVPLKAIYEDIHRTIASRW